MQINTKLVYIKNHKYELMILSIMREVKKRVLLTNGRSPMTLYLARLFETAGHEVYVTDPQRIHYCRFSNKVKKCFVVPSPRFSPLEHIASLVEIVDNVDIDLVVPTWEDIFLIAKHKDQFPKSCKLFLSDFELLNTVHNKWSFIQFLDQLGFETPETQIIRSKDDLANVDIERFALKPGFSRSSKNVFKVKRGGPLPDIHPSKDEEWIAQEWLEGDIYCTYTLCNKGKITAHSAYPMEFIRDQAGKGNTSVGSYCLSFSSTEHNGIYKWTEEFVKKTHFTGQIAFDFFETPKNQIYAFECNPRLTSGVTLFQNNDRLDRAFFALNKEPILASKESMKQILLGMLFFGWQPALVCKKMKLYIKKLFNAKDITFDSKDIKPFLSQPLIFIQIVFNSFKKRSSIPSAFTDDLDYNGEKS